LAEDQVNVQDIEEDGLDWDSIGTDTKFAGPPPFLGVVIVDELRPSSGEYAKNAHYWEFDVLDIRSRTQFVHRNRVNISRATKSKLGMIVASLHKLKAKFQVAAADSKKNPRPSELIGVVGWFERNEQDLNFGKQNYPYTKALRKATSEETAEALTVFGNYTPEAAEGSAPEAPTFEWNAEMVALAVGALEGQDTKTKLRAARSLPTDEPALRNAVTSGEAERYLVENGYLVMDDSGTYRKA